MPQIGVVTQNQSGIVSECSLSSRCIKENNGDASIPQKKTCLLAVDHGDRCQAWDNQKFTWLIHTDVNQIQQL